MRRIGILLVAAAACHAVAACRGPANVEHDSVVLAAAGAGNPTVAVSPRGDSAFAAWVETAGSVSNVHVAALDGAARGPAVRVNDIDGDAAAHDQAPPQVAVAPDGTIYVLWQNNTVIPGRRFPSSNLRLARSDDGGRSFSPAIFVNDDAHGAPASHTFQDIATAPDGTVYVSWIDGRVADRSEVRVAKSTDGGRTFSAGVVVEPNVCPCCRTSLAVSRDGDVAVAYRTATDDIRDIAVVRSSDGGETFSDPVIVHRDGWNIAGCPHAGASLAYGPDGRMHVAWYTGEESRQGLWYAASLPDGTSFGEPEPLQTGGWVPVSQVKLDADRDGTIWIAWDDRRADPSVVKLAVRDARSLRELRLSIAGSSPAIAAGNTAAIVAWQRDSVAAATTAVR